MKLVETKTYEFNISSAERKQLRDTADFLRKIEREIDNVIGEDYPIEIEEYEVYTAMDLWRAAEFLDGIALDNYQI